MPPELMELYNLYKQELETRNKKENQFVEELNNEIIRVFLIYFSKIRLLNSVRNTMSLYPGAEYAIIKRTRGGRSIALFASFATHQK